jgi:hypothetical protein
MSRRLVTVAVYDLPPHAHMARQALEAAGIRATVADDQMVGMDWLLSTAVGGVKVQVWEEDAERAAAVLESTFSIPTDGEVADESGSENSIGDRSETGEAYEPTEEDFAADAEPSVEAPQPPEPVEDRSRLARRAFFAAVIGFPLCPFAFYALYLCLNASFGPGPITPRGRFELVVAWALTALGIISPLYFVRLF